jgi:hypothetical protein
MKACPQLPRLLTQPPARLVRDSSGNRDCPLAQGRACCGAGVTLTKPTTRVRTQIVCELLMR